MYKLIRSFLNEQNIIEFEIKNISYNKSIKTYDKLIKHFEISKIIGTCLEGQEQDCIKFLSRKWLENIKDIKKSNELLDKNTYVIGLKQVKEFSIYELNNLLNTLIIQFEKLSN